MKKCANELCSYCTADLHLFFTYSNCLFSCAAAHIVIVFHVLDAFCECSFVVYTSTYVSGSISAMYNTVLIG